MSAAEVIELIKKLPPEERAEVLAFVNAGAVGESIANSEAPVGSQERTIRYISDEKFDEVVPQVFEKHKELFRRLAE